MVHKIATTATAMRWQTLECHFPCFFLLYFFHAPGSTRMSEWTECGGGSVGGGRHHEVSSTRKAYQMAHQWTGSELCTASNSNRNNNNNRKSACAKGRSVRRMNRLAINEQTEWRVGEEGGRLTAREQCISVCLSVCLTVWLTGDHSRALKHSKPQTVVATATATAALLGHRLESACMLSIIHTPSEGKMDWTVHYTSRENYQEKKRESWALSTRVRYEIKSFDF